MERMDSRTRYPSDLEEYLEMYGYNFNKKLYQFAVSMMRDRNGADMTPWELDKVNAFLREHGVVLKNNTGYNAAYVLMMAMSDYFNSSIPDDRHLAMYVRDYLDDIDGTKTRAFDEFYINCVAKGIPIFWSEML